MASEKLFNDFIDDSFPTGSKRTRSALIRREYADRIVRLLHKRRQKLLASR